MSDVIKRMFEGKEPFDILQSFLRYNKRVIQYRPEFLLKDLEKVLREAGVGEYSVEVRFDGRRITEKGSTKEVVEEIRKGRPERISMIIKVEGKEWGLEVDIDPEDGDRLFGVQEGYKVMRNIMKWIGREEEFERIMSKLAYPVMSKFAEVSRTVREFAEKIGEGDEEKARKVRDAMVEEAFLVVTLGAVRLDNVFLEGRIADISDEKPKEKIETKEDVLAYIGWFMLKLFKDCYMDEDELMLGFVYGRILLTNALMAILIKKLPAEMIELVGSMLDDRKNKEELN